jgi:hypothetical protein
VGGAIAQASLGSVYGCRDGLSTRWNRSPVRTRTRGGYHPRRSSQRARCQRLGQHDRARRYHLDAREAGALMAWPSALWAGPPRRGGEPGGSGQRPLPQRPFRVPGTGFKPAGSAAVPAQHGLGPHQESDPAGHVAGESAAPALNPGQPARPSKPTPSGRGQPTSRSTWAPSRHPGPRRWTHQRQRRLTLTGPLHIRGYAERVPFAEHAADERLVGGLHLPTRRLGPPVGERVRVGAVLGHLELVAITLTPVCGRGRGAG